MHVTGDPLDILLSAEWSSTAASTPAREGQPQAAWDVHVAGHAVGSDQQGRTVAVAVRTLEAPRAGMVGQRAAAALEALLDAIARGGDTAGELIDVAPYAAFVVVEPGIRLIARGDRMGTIRLHYRCADDSLAVSTDAGSLTSGARTRDVSPQALYDYVYFHAVPAPRAVRPHCAVLPLGVLVQLDRSGARELAAPHARWDGAPASPRQATDELLPLLRRAVCRTLPGEPQPTACFLSGGLDSSTVAALAAEALGGERVHAFTVGFEEERYDESEFAREAATRFNLVWHRYVLTADAVLESLDAIIDAMQEPFGNSSAVAVYHCARQARLAGFDAMLAGDGGDEIFGGNSRYAKQLLFERYLDLPAALRRPVEPMIDLFAHLGIDLARKAQSYTTQARIPLPDRLQSYNHLHRSSPVDVFTDRFLERVDPTEPIAMLREEYASCASRSAVNRMMQVDWRFTLYDNDLVKVNSMCSAAGVRVAYPMLDHDLVEFACRLPAHWKVRGQQLRWHYRQAIRDLLPAKIVDKKKHGFGLPFGVWMRTHAGLRAVAEQALSDLARRGIFRESFLDDTTARHRDEHASYYGELIWVLTVLELWLKRNAPALAF